MCDVRDSSLDDRREDGSGRAPGRGRRHRRGPQRPPQRLRLRARAGVRARERGRGDGGGAGDAGAAATIRAGARGRVRGDRRDAGEHGRGAVGDATRADDGGPRERDVVPARDPGRDAAGPRDAAAPRGSDAGVVGGDPRRRGPRGREPAGCGCCVWRSGRASRARRWGSRLIVDERGRVAALGFDHQGGLDVVLREPADRDDAALADDALEALEHAGAGHQVAGDLERAVGVLAVGVLEPQRSEMYSTPVLMLVISGSCGQLRAFLPSRPLSMISYQTISTWCPMGIGA